MATKREAAFPQPIGDTSGLLHEPDPGMDLRDWFAGKALVGTIAESGLMSDVNDDHTARRCYQLADAMMRAREAR